jgi:hypothetical protein
LRVDGIQESITRFERPYVDIEKLTSKCFKGSAEFLPDSLCCSIWFKICEKMLKQGTKLATQKQIG